MIALGPFPLLQQPVTYNCRATAIPAVLTELSKATGVTMIAKDEAKSEIVFLHVDGLPLDSLMRKIAFVTSCEWVKSGDSYTLKPAASVRRKEDSSEADREAADWRQSLEGQIAELEAKKKRSQEREPKPITINGGSDESLVYQDDLLTALRLASLIDFGGLASAPEDRPTVWVTNNPTESQRLLPEESRQIVADWGPEHDRVARIWTIEGSGLPAQTPEERQALRNFEEASRPLPLEIAKTLLIVRREHDQLSLEMRCFDRKGASVKETQSWLGIDRRDPMDLVFKRTPDGTIELERSKRSGLAPLELSHDSTAISQAYRHGAVMRSGLPADVLDRLYDPARYDPLSLTPSDVIDCYRRNGHPQVVADVPDSLAAANALLRLPDSVYRTNRSMDFIDGGSKVTVSENDSVTLIRPVAPAENRASRLNRSDFAVLLKRVRDHGSPSLDQKSAYALNNPVPEDGPLGGLYREFVKCLLDGGAANSESWDALRLYGSLDHAQREALWSGGGVDLSTLTSSQRQLAEDFVCSRAASLEPLDELGQPLPELAREPSEMLASGLNHGLLTCTVSSSPGLFFDPSEGGPSGYMVDARQYGQLLAMIKGSPNPGAALSPPPKVKMGQIARLDLVFRVARAIGVRTQLIDLQIPDTPFVSIDQVPSDFLTEAMRSEKQTEEVTAGKETGKSEASP